MQFKIWSCLTKYALCPFALPPGFYKHPTDLSIDLEIKMQQEIPENNEACALADQLHALARPSDSFFTHTVDYSEDEEDQLSSDGMQVNTAPIADQCSTHAAHRTTTTTANNNKPDGSVTSPELPLLSLAAQHSQFVTLEDALAPEMVIIAMPSHAAVTAARAAVAPRRPGSRVHSNWPETMVSTRFFGTCSHHRDARKSELNFFCLGCAPTGGDGDLMCQFCSAEHAHCCDGRIIQMYRYMYHDVVRVATVNDLINLDGIQQYKANNHPAVHLRPMGPPLNKSPYTSFCQGNCGRFLDPRWDFCSLSCKLGLQEADYEPRLPDSTDKKVSRSAAASGSKSNGGGNGGGMKRAGSSSGVTNMACDASAPVTVACSGEALLRQWSDEEGDPYNGLMTTRRGAGVMKRLGLVKKVLKGAQKRKPLWPQRSPSL